MLVERHDYETVSQAINGLATRGYTTDFKLEPEKDKIVDTLKMFLDKKIKDDPSLQKSILKERFNIEETTKKYLQHWKVQ